MSVVCDGAGVLAGVASSLITVLTMSVVCDGAGVLAEGQRGAERAAGHQLHHLQRGQPHHQPGPSAGHGQLHVRSHQPGLSPSVRLGQPPRLL